MVKNNFVLINNPRQTCPTLVDTCSPTSEPEPRRPWSRESNLISGRLCIQLRKRCTFVLLAVRVSCSINSSTWLPGAQDASLFSVIIILRAGDFWPCLLHPGHAWHWLLAEITRSQGGKVIRVEWIPVLGACVCRKLFSELHKGGRPAFLRP